MSLCVASYLPFSVNCCESAGKVTPGRRSKGPPSLGLHVTLYSGASFESSYGGRWESCHSSASASPERSIKVRNRWRDGGHKDGGSAVVQAAVEVTVGVAAVEQRVARGCERRASGQPARLPVECRPRDVDKPAVGVGQVIAEGCFPWRGTVGPGEASRSSGGRVLGSLCKRRGAALGAATSPTDARLGLMFEVAHGRGRGESRRSQRRWETALTGTHGFPGGTLGSTTGFGRPSAGRSEADSDAARPADGQAAVNDGPGAVEKRATIRMRIDVATRPRVDGGG